MLWTKRAHQSTIFQTFECSNESSSNYSCHFWNHKVTVYSNFPSLFSVMKDNSSLFLLVKAYILWANWSEIFRLSSGWVKIYQIRHAMFETTSQFFFKLYITRQCYGRQLFCTFLVETLYDLDKKKLSKCKISDFWLLTLNFTKFVLS